MTNKILIEVKTDIILSFALPAGIETKYPTNNSLANYEFCTSARPFVVYNSPEVQTYLAQGKIKILTKPFSAEAEDSEFAELFNSQGYTKAIKKFAKNYKIDIIVDLEDSVDDDFGGELPKKAK